MNRLIGTGLFSACAAVALGAFGTHSLAKILDEHMLDVFKTGQSYHLALSLLLLAVALSGPPTNREKECRSAFWIIFCGMLIFSCSLYILAVTGMKWMGAITPIGGILIIGSLAWLATKMFLKPQSSS